MLLEDQHTQDPAGHMSEYGDNCQVTKRPAKNKPANVCWGAAVPALEKDAPSFLDLTKLEKKKKNS